jgi:hypothetical protein
MDKETIYAIIVAALIFYIVCSGRKDGLTSRPTGVMKQKYANLILSNPELFNPNVNLSKVRDSIPWIDAVLFNDIKLLKRNNDFNFENIEKILS